MRYYILVVFLILLFLSGCSNFRDDDYVIKTLEEQFNNEVNAADIKKLTISNREIVIYQSSDKIFVCIFTEKELLKVNEIDYNALSSEKIFYAYSEDSKEDLYYVTGGIAKDKTPLLLLNKKPLETDIISMDHAYIFISLFEKPLDKPAKFELGD
ncbi:hypothetical protein [Paenisporosarcina quisquiliarum]|uniref:hypothetical protein n=1 Tax=Paenisporosarcina quisquiliarum TaxID=365346 RepID=UPI003734FE62